jgi:hypothetical protein
LVRDPKNTNIEGLRIDELLKVIYIWLVKKFMLSVLKR